ncbi:hypothetical protein [Streptomyces sp. NPDC046197]
MSAVAGPWLGSAGVGGGAAGAGGGDGGVVWLFYSAKGRIR